MPSTTMGVSGFSRPFILKAVTTTACPVWADMASDTCPVLPEHPVQSSKDAKPMIADFNTVIRPPRHP